MQIIIVDADRNNPGGEQPHIFSILPIGGLLRGVTTV